LAALSKFVFLPFNYLIDNSSGYSALAMIYPGLILSFLWIFSVSFLFVFISSKITTRQYVAPLLMLFLLFLGSNIYSNRSINSCIEHYRGYKYLENTSLVWVNFGAMSHVYETHWDGEKDDGVKFPEQSIKFLSYIYGFRSIIPTYINTDLKLISLNQVYAKVTPGAELKVQCSIERVFGPSVADTRRPEQIFVPSYDGNPEFWSNVNKDFCNTNNLSEDIKSTCLRSVDAGFWQKSAYTAPIAVFEFKGQSRGAPGSPVFKEIENNGKYSNKLFSFEYPVDIYQPQVSYFDLSDGLQIEVFLYLNSSKDGSRWIRFRSSKYEGDGFMSNNAMDGYNAVRTGKEDPNIGYSKYEKISIGDYSFIKFVDDFPKQPGTYPGGKDRRVGYSITVDGKTTFDVDAEFGASPEYYADLERVLKTLKIYTK
jgi:hypothetical protein